MSNICISITTIPSRINFIIPTLQSFLDQKPMCKMIYICIPKFSVRFQKEYVVSDELKEFIDSNDKIKIVWCPDYGPGTKLLGCLDEVEPTDNILICDDDRKFKPNIISKFSNMIKSNPKTILCGRYSSQNQSRCKVMWGSLCILIPRSLVDDDIYKIHYAMSNCCRYVDDVFWARYFIELKKKVPVVVNNISVFSEHCGQNALYKETGELKRNSSDGIQFKCEKCKLPSIEELEKISSNPYRT